MQVKFTKMQGAGNDFIVLDETSGSLGLSAKQYRWLADRHFGVGADQILSVRAAPQPNPNNVDFTYVIHNADGSEVEHCGNGARCFYLFLQAQKLSSKPRIRVQTRNRVLELYANAENEVVVDMGKPDFSTQAVHFASQGMHEQKIGAGSLWSVDLHETENKISTLSQPESLVFVCPVSMGNPHAVQLVNNLDEKQVDIVGAILAKHHRFAQGVNAGFMQILSRQHIALRVYERGAGQTLACGTGACAAVVAGIKMGLLDPDVKVDVSGGCLRVQWSGQEHDSAFLSGPAQVVYCGEVDVPEVN